MAELTITKDNFKQEVLNSDIPVLVDFWATWCSPCKMLSPVIEEIANELDGKVKVGKINVDENPELAAEFGVTGIPFVVAFRDGEPRATSMGVVAKEDILALL
ncbi:MAG: thioredoxin, partial [Clostridia bacterium]|nr:thioredoxin [Clostridia bacterium]